MKNESKNLEWKQTLTKEVKHEIPKTTIKDVYEELKNEFGEIVEYKQED